MISKVDGELLAECNMTFAEKQRELPFAAPAEKEDAADGETAEAVNGAE